MQNLLLENISKEELKQNLKQLYSFLKQKMPKINRDPQLFLKQDKKNANDIIGKTGYYDIEKEQIYLFVTDRHPKDILRSFAHEVIHHEQKCSGMTDKLDLSKTHDVDYASKDNGLRKAEQDAFTRGNMFFRDWTDALKAKKIKEMENMNEEKLRSIISGLVAEVLNETKVPDSVVTKAHKIGKSIAKSGGAENPFAVGMAKAKQQAGIKEKKKPKNEVEEAESLARQHAKTHVENYMGDDLKKMKKEQYEKNEQEAKENLEESGTPHQELFQKKERVFNEEYTKRDNEVYDALVKKFLEG